MLKKTANGTTFSCNLDHWDVTSNFCYVLILNIPVYILVILNTITTIHLRKSIKSRSHLNRNTSSESKLSVRFSIANIFASSFVVVLFLINFIIKINLCLGLGRNLSFKEYPFTKYIYLFLAAINPVMYLILFRNFRRFVICKS